MSWLQVNGNFLLWQVVSQHSPLNHQFFWPYNGLSQPRWSCRRYCSGVTAIYLIQQRLWLPWGQTVSTGQDQSMRLMTSGQLVFCSNQKISSFTPKTKDFLPSFIQIYIYYLCACTCGHTCHDLEVSGQPTRASPLLPPRGPWRWNSVIPRVTGLALFFSTHKVLFTDLSHAFQSKNSFLILLWDKPSNVWRCHQTFIMCSLLEQQSQLLQLLPRQH